MLDATTIAALASAAGAIVAPLLQSAFSAASEETGKGMASLALGKLKGRLSHAGAREALDDLEKQPADKELEGAFSVQLRKALRQDPELADFLTQWIDDARPSVSTSQVADARGENIRIYQLSGNNHRIG